MCVSVGRTYNISNFILMLNVYNKKYLFLTDSILLLYLPD